jgi:hypothetical protein
MTENLKPASKVIQISTSSVQNTISTQTYIVTTALCEDGSVWEHRMDHNDWFCILEALKPAVPTIPIPGNWLTNLERND